MKSLIVILIVMLMSGCTSARISRSLSSGAIGCQSDKIKIFNEKASASGTHEWIAECNGTKYVCNYVYGSTTNCKELK